MGPMFCGLVFTAPQILPSRLPVHRIYSESYDVPIRGWGRRRNPAQFVGRQRHFPSLLQTSLLCSQRRSTAKLKTIWQLFSCDTSTRICRGEERKSSVLYSPDCENYRPFGCDTTPSGAQYLRSTVTCSFHLSTIYVE